MRVVRKLAVGAATLALAVTGSIVPAAPAAAAEPFLLTLVCDNGKSYDVEITGNGDFTPARDTASNAVLVPVEFGMFTGTVRDAQGNVLDTFTEPGETKGSGKQKSNATCRFDILVVSDGSDPEFPEGFSFEGSGTVRVKITPQGRSRR